MFTDTPSPATPAPTKTTARPAVDYDRFVLVFARQISRFVILAFAGVTLVIGGIMYSTGTPMVIIIAVGLGLAAGGATGAAAAVGAHSIYARTFGRIETTHYPEPPPAAPAVRAFMPSSAGPRTVRAGKFQLPADAWAGIFAAAQANGGRLTRDAAQRHLPRVLYRQWSETLSELARLGIVDNDGNITAGGWQFANETVGTPYPTTGNGHTSAHGTHAQRPNGAPGGLLS